MHVQPHLIVPVQEHTLGCVENRLNDGIRAMEKNRGPERPASQFDEADYCFGSGPLRLRVERVHWDHPVEYRGDLWYEVDGVEISNLGQHVGRRSVLIRARCLTRLPSNRRH